MRLLILSLLFLTFIGCDAGPSDTDKLAVAKMQWDMAKQELSELEAIEQASRESHKKTDAIVRQQLSFDLTPEKRSAIEAQQAEDKRRREVMFAECEAAKQRIKKRIQESYNAFHAIK